MTPPRVPPARQWRKKPVIIEAVQWTGDFACLDGFVRVSDRLRHTRTAGNDALIISTLEGDMCADIGDWIIRGVKGEFYPCKPDIFALTYEPAATPSEDSGPRDTLDSLADEIRVWSKQAFGKVTNASRVAHLKKEVEELTDHPDDPEEWADVFHFVAQVEGFDLVAAIRAKLEKNKSRAWGQPDADGVVEHVREAPVPAAASAVEGGGAPTLDELLAYRLDMVTISLEGARQYIIDLRAQAAAALATIARQGEELAKLKEDSSGAWECIVMAQECLDALIYVKAMDRGAAAMFLPEAIRNACILVRDESLAYAEEDYRALTAEREAARRELKYIREHVELARQKCGVVMHNDVLAANVAKIVDTLHRAQFDLTAARRDTERLAEGLKVHRNLLLASGYLDRSLNEWRCEFGLRKHSEETCWADALDNYIAYTLGRPAAARSAGGTPPNQESANG